jgi:ATP-dependent Clp protease ATP-binding subunit ClpB
MSAKLSTNPESQQRADLRNFLRKRIRGQDHVLPRICSVVERGLRRLQPPGRPRGSMMFLGPTGVGKTELALAFTEYCLGAVNLMRFDMSEFQHADGIKLLLGDHTGDVGRLGRALESREAGTFLFDEIEKAHPLVLDAFLQILDAGRITVGQGITHDLQSFFIVCTSNIGSAEIIGQSRLPFSSVERFVLGRLHQCLRPELIGRFQEILIFRKLDFDTQKEIAALTLDRYLRFLETVGFDLEFDPDVVDFLARQGIHRTLGARPLRNAVERYVGDAVCVSKGFGRLVVDGKAQRLAVV